ncbi:hypothetical protein V1505DRAFT_424240 [Lipomyces doorenjongii]
MTPYSLPAQCDVRSKLIARCAHFLLDPRVKGDLLMDELEDEDAAREILQALRLSLHRNYPVDSQTPSLSVQSTQHCTKKSSGSHMFRRLKPLAVEAINGPMRPSYYGWPASSLSYPKGAYSSIAADDAVSDTVM